MSDDVEHDELRLAEIIRLFPEPDEHDAEQPATRNPKAERRTLCSHPTVSIDLDARRLHCRNPACGIEVDPLDFLIQLSGKWERIVRWRKEAERRARKASERLEEILRLERNARSRLKRIDPSAKPPAVPWGEGSSSSIM